MTTKWVVAHMGRRDQYEIAYALQEADLLERLVTDMFFPFDKPYLAWLSRCVEKHLPYQIRARYKQRLPSQKVSAQWGIALRNKFDEHWRMMESDSCLGAVAGRLARKRNAAILTYLPYAYSAFSAHGKGYGPNVVFHYSAYPPSVQRTLRQHGADFPNSMDCCLGEHEVRLSSEEMNEYIEGTVMADFHIVPSQYVGQTLIEHGISSEQIAIVPYGVDVRLFQPVYSIDKQIFRVAFIGNISYRKGVRHLLEAWRLLDLPNVELLLVGTIDRTSYAWLSQYDGLYHHVTYLPHDQVAEIYQSCTLLCMPSLSEGLSLTILEAMACATPVIASANSGADSVIREGVDGFIVEAGNVDVLKDRLRYCYEHRSEMIVMRRAARKRAEMFTWQRFRDHLIACLSQLPVTVHPSG